MLNGINSFSHMLFAVFGYLMRLAPVGAFGAMAFTVGKYGIKSIGSLGPADRHVLPAPAASSWSWCSGVLARMHGLSLYRVLRYFREELLVVLGTSSSEPVLPRLLMKLERLGCKRGVVGLVLPTGYSFNLDGTAIYLTLASLFIAQACDIDAVAVADPRHDRSDAADLEGCRRRHRQRVRRPGRHPRGASRPCPSPGWR